MQSQEQIKQPSKTFIFTPCPVCQSENLKLKYEIKGYKLQRCLNCKLVYMNPRPSDEWINTLYDEEYFEGKGFDQSVDYKNEFLKPSPRELALHQLKLNDISFLIHRSQSKKSNYRFLDVGCGYGLFLQSAKKRGYEIEGVEICKEVAEFAQKHIDAKIYQGPASDAIEKLKPNSYDVITMIEVLEHLPNPVKVISRCRELLTPGGVLFIQTGNIHSPKAIIARDQWNYFTLPGHICYYSPQSIRELLLRSGFMNPIICPPRVQHQDSKAYQWLKRKNLLNEAYLPRNFFGKSLLKLTDFSLNSRERLLSPGLFAYGIK